MGKQRATEMADGTEYGGPAGISRDSVWLTNEDIPHDRDTVVVIDRVLYFESVVYPNQQRASKVLALTFKRGSRMLRVNATMKRVLNALGGNNNCACWKGLRIALYVEPDIGYADGTRGPAVRIRSQLPPEPNPSQAEQEVGDEDEVDGDRQADKGGSPSWSEEIEL